MTAEDWYRRLLLAYPAEHRAEYGEEMVGVLLAQEPGRPALGETLNVLLAGVRLRLRSLRRGFGWAEWRDALAVASLIAPLILLTTTVDQLAQFSDYFAGDLGVSGGYWGSVAANAPAWLGWPVILAVAYWGRRPGRRIGALGAAVLTVWTAQANLQAIRMAWGVDLAQTALAILPFLAVAGLAFSPGPRRGVQVIGKVATRWILAMTGVAFVAQSLADFQRLWGPNPIPRSAPLYLYSWGLVLLVMTLGLRRAVGRRAGALLAAPVFSTIGTYGFQGGNGTNDTAMGVPVILLGFVLPTVLGTLLVIAFARRPRATRSAEEDS